MKVIVRCPACRKNGEIEVTKDDVDKSQRGLLAINIRSGTYCEHTYIAYVDQNLKVRDCFLTDFEIQIPDVETTEGKADIDIPSKEKFDTKLLKMNLPVSSIAYGIRGIIFKQPILILSEQKFLFPQIKEFFDYITQNSFEIQLEVLTREEYVSNKKKFKEFLIFEGNEVVNDKEGIMEKRPLKVERTVAGRFYSELDPKSSAIILKNELMKSYELTKILVEFISEIKGEEIQLKKLIDHLTMKGIEIEIPYLKFLLDAAEYYFEIEFKRSSEISDFLGFL